MTSRYAFLAGASLLIVPVGVFAQEPAQPAVEQQQQAEPEPLPEYEDEETGTIVVTGAKPRGSVVGEIPPEDTLTSRDVLATGATDIEELLEALAPQVGSARGRDGGRRHSFPLPKLFAMRGR